MGVSCRYFDRPLDVTGTAAVADDDDDDDDDSGDDSSGNDSLGLVS